MSDHKDQRGHHRDHQTHSQAGGNPPWRKRAHKDWRVWVVVGLMLAAMVAYVLTMDESVQPGGQVNPEVPAAP